MKKFAYLFLFAVALSLCGCERAELRNRSDSGKGILNLNIDMQGSKSAMSRDELLSNASVNIYYSDFSGKVAEFKYSEMPDPFMMPVGEYRVDVIAGEETAVKPRRVNWEQISYKGSETFEIVAGEVCNLDIVANVHSAVLQVNFDGSVPANVKEGFKLEIGTDDNNLVTYGYSENGRQSYAIVSDLDEPSLIWKFSGFKSSNGAEISRNDVIKDVKPGKKYELNIKYTVKEGFVDFDVTVDSSMEVIEQLIVFDPRSTGLTPSSPFEIWAGHATVHADVDESEYGKTAEIAFRYSTDGTQWSSIAATRISEGNYEALIAGLTPDTKYEYRLNINGEDVGNPLYITTDVATPIPNGSFEETSKSQSGNYTEFYNPNAADAMNRTPWWGSGNGSAGISGSADMGYPVCVPDYNEFVDGKVSARLQSSWAVVKFAAGNIFSGYFGGLVGTKGGRVYFGRPFTSRPTGIRFWAKYSTGKVNRIDDSCPYPVSTNDYDKARFMFVLGNWPNVKYGGTKECPVQFNTTEKSTLINFEECEETVAYAEKILQGASDDPYNSWAEYTLKFDYKKDNVIPQFFVVSIAASMYGDYFTGCDSSRLWIDKMELIYE